MIIIYIEDSTNVPKSIKDFLRDLEMDKMGMKAKKFKFEKKPGTKGKKR